MDITELDVKDGRTWSQIHQRVYTQLLRMQIQKHKKESQFKQLCVLLGSAGVKALRRMMVKLTPGANPIK